MRTDRSTGIILAGRLIALWVGCWASAALADVELYVSPRGDDSWSGRVPEPNADLTDGPLASLAAAQKALRKRPIVSEQRKVVIENGRYQLKEPIVFTPADSGTDGQPVVYEAARGAQPVFSGAISLSEWTVDRDGRWRAKVPAGVKGDEIEQLWINGRRAKRARSPNTGYWVVTSVGTFIPEESANRQPAGTSRDWLQYKLTVGGPAAAVSLPELPTLELSSVRLVTLQSWEMTRRRLTDYAAGTATLGFFGPVLPTLTRLRVGTRVYLEGATSFLDEPGEWSADADGTVHYLPKPGEQPEKTKATIAQLDQLVVFQGGVAGPPTENIKLRGLVFEYGRWTSPPHGINPEQAAHTIEATIELKQSRRITLEACEIAHVGRHAIWIRAGCSEVSLVGNFLHDIGAGGIRIGEEETTPDPTRQTEGNIVDNNIIRGGGRLFESAVAVWIGQSGKNRVTHNDISEFNYTGVSVGWTWGYGPSQAAGNVIRYNRIRRVGGPLSDLGGIYFLGNSPGTECIGNWIENVSAAEYGGWGIYLDEGSSNLAVRDNLVWGTTSGGFHQHFGRHNRVTNNVFAFGRNAQLELGRSELEQSLVFERNVVIWNGGRLFAGNWADGPIESDYNLYLATRFSLANFFGRPLTGLRAKGRESHSVLTTTTMNPQRGFSWDALPGSDLAAIGFHPADAVRPGVYGDPAWRELAEKPED